MKTIYIDDNFQCFTKQNENSSLREITTNFFDEKCDTYIEGYRFIPEGDVWTRKDGQSFKGEMVSPLKDSTYLSDLQQEVEKIQYQLELSYAEGVNSI